MTCFCVELARWWNQGEGALFLCGAGSGVEPRRSTVEAGSGVGEAQPRSRQWGGGTREIDTVQPAEGYMGEGSFLCGSGSMAE